jgi:hypothetical protein
MVRIDSETLFSGAAALMATIAVGYFIFTLAFPYSPVSKLMLVLGFVAGIVALVHRASDYETVVLGYAVVVFSVLFLFFDLVNTFDLGDGVTVLGLLLLAGVLFGLRSALDETGHLLTRQRATAAFGVLAALAILVVVVDIASGGLAYELQTGGAVEFTEEPHRDLVIGQVAASNPTPLPERVEAPEYGACAAGNWSEYRRPGHEDEPERPVTLRVHVDDGYNDHVMGYSTKSYPLEMHPNAANLSGTTMGIEQTDACPVDDDGSPYIAIFPRPEDSRGPPHYYE